MQTFNKFSRSTRVLLAGAALMLSAAAVAAPAKQVLCVWDIAGTQGDVYNLMKDYKLAAARWGANIELKPYTASSMALPAVSIRWVRSPPTSMLRRFWQRCPSRMQRS